MVPAHAWNITANRLEDAIFICVPGPGWLANFIYDEHYGNQKEFIFALAEAIREEYCAVVDAGFILQIDDPAVVIAWDMIKPEPTLEEYRCTYNPLLEKAFVMRGGPLAAGYPPPPRPKHQKTAGLMLRG